MNTPTTEPIMIFNIRFSLFFHIPSLLKFLFTQGRRPGAAYFTVPFYPPRYSRVESVQRQLERAVSARVITKGGQCEPGAAGGVEYVLVEIGDNAVNQHLSRLADAAADDHHLRVNGGAYVAKELSE